MERVGRVDLALVAVAASYLNTLTAETTGTRPHASTEATKRRNKQIVFVKLSDRFGSGFVATSGSGIRSAEFNRPDLNPWLARKLRRPIYLTRKYSGWLTFKFSTKLSD
jgi:hypothetical protein